MAPPLAQPRGLWSRRLLELRRALGELRGRPVDREEMPGLLAGTRRARPSARTYEYWESGYRVPPPWAQDVIEDREREVVAAQKAAARG